MSEAKDTTEKETQNAPAEAAAEAPAEESSKKAESGPWYSKPEQFGNAAGDKIQGALNPVGQPVGKGLETVTKPVGSLLDPLLGGVLRAGQTFQDQAGKDKEGGAGKTDAGGPVGGQEQSGDNPLGLSDEYK